MRHAIILGILGTACTGTLDGGGGPGSGSGSNPGATDVQITVRDGQTPQANVSVIFQNPDDTVADQVTTDATGLAVAEMPNGGSVTVVRTYPVPQVGDPRAAEAYTYVGVKPGDRLTLGNPKNDQGLGKAVNILVPVNANGTVTVMSNCGTGQGTAPTVAITTYNCGAEIGLYVVDGDNSSFFKKAAFSDNIDVSMEGLQAPVSSSISATNVTAGSTVNVTLQLGYDGYEFYTTNPQRVDTAPAAVDLPIVTGVDELIRTEVSLNGNTRVIASRKPFSGGTTTVDASANVVANITTPAFTPTAITWVEEAPGEPLDFVVAMLNVQRAGAGTTGAYIRTIIAPYDPSMSLRMPVLPVTMYNPAMEDSVATSVGLGKITGGYDAARPLALSNTSLLEAAPMNGSLTVSYTGNLGL
jgi:hypothetical protein